MNKLIIAIALCAVLVACKKEAAPVAPAAASETATAAAPAATDPVASGLPVECEDYLNRVKACVSKAGGGIMAEQFQQSLDQAKAQWDAVPDKSSLVTSCKAANEQFTQAAAALKCE